MHLTPAWAHCFFLPGYLLFYFIPPFAFLGGDAPTMSPNERTDTQNRWGRTHKVTKRTDGHTK